jgi:hypothetical protein
VRYFRKLTKDWSANIDVDIRKKEETNPQCDILDIKCESEDLLEAKRNRFSEIYSELINFWLMEEIKAKKSKFLIFCMVRICASICASPASGGVRNPIYVWSFFY